MNADEYEISTEPGRLNLELVHEFLANHTYWAREIPREVVERSIRNSLTFGVYRQDEQVGFARVISDRATFAYLSDIFVIPAHRGRGVSKLIVKTILAHPDLQGLRRWVLATADAQGLYAQFGFEPLANPEQFMTIHRPDVYQGG